ncbi:MAG: hypothetical protein QOE08_1105 [Thermoleophilaceae bacterium]|nr:hypothetical protein [Thermoleophilaceae bacterium]
MSDRTLRRAVAVLALLGVAVAAYLTWVHYAGTKPLCVAGGGGCERVQTSDYAKLAGVPVALIGLLGYLAILASLWLRGEAQLVGGALLALTGFGFSAYLTYRELFTIDAICQWCVVSAALMTALAILTTVRLVRG